MGRAYRGFGERKRINVIRRGERSVPHLGRKEKYCKNSERIGHVSGKEKPVSRGKMSLVLTKTRGGPEYREGKKITLKGFNGGKCLDRVEEEDARGKFSSSNEIKEIKKVLNSRKGR